MPNATISRSPVFFRGVPTFHAGDADTLSPEFSPTRFPVGFDAVAQFDHRLVHVQLLRNLQAAGAAALGARVPFGTEGFPPEVLAAVAPHVGPLENVGLQATFLEMRLRDPRLITLGAGPEPQTMGGVVTTGGVVFSPHLFAEGERPVPPAVNPADPPDTVRGGSSVGILWTLELNLLRVTRELVLTANVNPPSTGLRTLVPRGGLVEVGGVLTHEEPRAGAGSSASESRVLLAAGRAVTRTPVHVATRAELLQAWLELDVARTETTATADDPRMAALLNTPRGKDMLRSALATLVTQGGLRLSPRVALAGSLAPQQVAALGLTAMRVVHAMHKRPDGSEVLSLCFNFGDDAGGSLAQLQPFLGGSNFAFYVSLATLTPVLRTRWRLQPAAREFVGDVPVEMPLHEGSEETGQGMLRVRVRLGGTLSEVGLMAIEGEHGDVLRLACHEEVQLLRAWYADGSEVGELGEWGVPATLPLVVNVAPFTAAAADEERNTPFRALLRHVLEPVALPFVERFAVRGVSGFASEALGAMVARWSLPRIQEGIMPELGPEVLGGVR